MEDVLLYFWNASCSVCEPLYDKLEVMIKDQFPKLEIKKVNVADHPELVTRYGIYSSPLILLLLDGREYFRSGTNVSLHELKSKIHRLYDLKFGE